MITAWYALPLVALYIFLSLHVVNARKAQRVSIGDGGNGDLALRIRTHGNLAEYAPFGIVMLLLAELAGAGAIALHLSGAALILGRALHAWALGFGGPMRARVAGMGLTFLSLAASAVLAILA
ncbi:MAPEG family protein [Paenirhodobacter hankyongi]|uniref:Glutathione metabolism protein n=1 Tax=Paenirhodobacter hankyongi TaxID=2294033 RepID=A0A421BXB0_9RHOB|nr:MAPEG family protein [Sinirhodobacter hankyongi]RLL72976.1 glutathione metabolism protein [Sinirhodobacter hankyongi]